MATLNPTGVERRHIFDRRSNTTTTNTANRNVTTTHSAMSAMDWIAMTLLIVGGVNWGLVGVLNVDLVAEIFGPMTTASRVVYALVGLSALWAVYTVIKLSGKKVS